MTYKGDFAPGSVVEGWFNTRDTDGAPATLGGSPLFLRVYKGSSVSEDDSGITLTPDFDGITGLNYWAIDTSADGTFYAAGANFCVMIREGIVDGILVVGVVIGEFSLNNRSALRPTTAGRTIDVSTGGEVELIDDAITAAKIAANAIGSSELADGAITAAKFAAGAITATVIATDAIDADAVAADAVTEIQSGLATAAALATVDDFLDTEIAAILADTNELQTDWANGGRLDNILDARASQASVDTIDGIVDAILADTGTDGVVVAAGSKTGYTLSTAGLAAFFTADSGETYADAIAGSVVKEIADNAGGASLTVQDIVDGVWNADLDYYQDASSAGEALAAAGTAGDPWTTGLPGAYGAGTAGFIVGTNLNATITSRASQTSLDTVDGIVDSILADTGTDGVVLANDAITAAKIAANAIGSSEIADGAITAAKFAAGAITATVIATDAIDADALAADAVTEIQSGLATAANLATVAGYLDTEIAAILADTNELQTDWANGGRLDVILDARASQASVDTIDGIVDAILLDTGTDGVVVASIAAGAITAAAIATGAIDADAFAADAGTELADAIWDEAVDGAVTARQSIRLANAALGGKASGLATTNALYRDLADTKNRIDATVDADGNRSAVTRDLT